MQSRRYLSLKWWVLAMTGIISLFIAAYQYRVTQTHLQDFFTQEHRRTLARMEQMLDAAYQQWERKTEQIAGLVGALPGLSAAMQAGAYDTVQGLIEERRNLLQLDDGIQGMAVYDRTGRRLGHWGIPAAEQASTQALARGVLHSSWPAATIKCRGGQCRHYIAVPVLGTQGEQAGVIVLGFDLADLIQSFQLAPGTSVSLVRDTAAPVFGLDGAQPKIEVRPKTLQLPAGYRLQASIDARQEQEAIHTLQMRLMQTMAIGVALAAVLMLLLLWGELSRLGAVGASLSLLAEERFTELRQRLSRVRRGLISSEVDLLIDSTIDSIHKLERLHAVQAQANEAEAARRAAALVSVETARSVEAEKRRIARELHDELGQTMVSLLFEAQAIANSKDLAIAQSRARGIAESVRMVYADINRLVDQLRPEVLDTVGIQKALTGMVADWQALRPDCAYQLTLEGTLDALPDEVQIALYRVIQESLTNIAKHAQAQTVQIHIQQQAEALRLEIRDDGIGFDPAAAAGGMGLPGLKQRLAALNGKLDIESQPGQGTRLRASIPLQANRPT